MLTDENVWIPAVIHAIGIKTTMNPHGFRPGKAEDANTDTVLYEYVRIHGTVSDIDCITSH